MSTPRILLCRHCNKDEVPGTGFCELHTGPNSYQKIMALLAAPDLTDQQISAVITQYVGRLARSPSELKGVKLAECLQTIATYLSSHLRTGM